MPISALMICPPNKARGCAAGAVESPNKKTVDPPMEARNKGELGGLVKYSTKARETDAPKAIHNSLNRITPLRFNIFPYTSN
jgi:hypothetical protein